MYRNLKTFCAALILLLAFAFLGMAYMLGIKAQMRVKKHAIMHCPAAVLLQK